MSSASLLLTLPGEIRNQIFDLCVQEAMIPRKKGRRSILNTFPTPEVRSITVSVLPRWSGPGLMRIQGIGSLPLLFVNKQIYSELSYIVYSKVDSVSLGGYMVERADEDPSVRWDITYSLLKKQPNLLKFTKKVKIHMPRLREDLYRGYFMSISHKTPNIKAVYNRWAVVPSLRTFLLNFEQLSSLEIFVVPDEQEAPDFDGLFPIYDLYGKNTDMEFPTGFKASTLTTLTSSRWSFAWEEDLRKSGRL